MKTLRDREDLLPAGDHERHAQRVFVGLGPGVHEKDAFEPGRRHASQLLGRVSADIECDGVALEQQFACLLLDCVDKARVSIAERRNGVAAVKVENAATVLGVNVAAARLFWHERQLSVHGNRQRRLAEPGVAGLLADRRHQVHPGAGAVSPAVSGRLQSRFIHCTAPPAAPLTRLSIAAMTTTVSPSAATPM